MAAEAFGDHLRLGPLDDTGLGVRDLHLSGDAPYLAGPTMALTGEIRVFQWHAARRSVGVNREPVRFEEALTESVPLPHGRGTNGAEALCKLPSALSEG